MIKKIRPSQKIVDKAPIKSSSDGRVQLIGDVEYRYSSAWIHSLESEEHWRLYWQQQNLMEGAMKPGWEILEIGVGSGFTANYLRAKGVKVTTLDIDAEKKPDIVSNIVNFNWEGLAFDNILAFEVFEHIPFLEFCRVLGNLSDVCREFLFLSVPKAERVWVHLETRIPKIGAHQVRLVSRKRQTSEPHHFWEIGAGATKEELIDVFTKNGFAVCGQQEKFSRLFFKLKSSQNRANDN